VIDVDKLACLKGYEMINEGLNTLTYLMKNTLAD